ncbi:hypothetical protein ACTA71_007637 [Dictyostelium dimigraforme]
MESFKNINTEVNIGKISCDVKELLGSSNNKIRKTISREYFKIPFSNIPNVSVGLCGFQNICNPACQIYFDIKPINITKTYFDIDFTIWGDFKSIHNFVVVNYTAVNHEPIVENGELQTQLPPPPPPPPQSPPKLLNIIPIPSSSFYTSPPPLPPLPLSLLPFPLKLNKGNEKIKEELENLPPFPFLPNFNQTILDDNNKIIVESFVSIPTTTSQLPPPNPTTISLSMKVKQPSPPLPTSLLVSPMIISYKRFIGKEVLIKNIKYSTFIRDNNGKIDLSISNRKLEMVVWKIETYGNNNDTIMILNKQSNKYLMVNSIDIGGSLINSNDIKNHCDRNLEWKLEEIRPNVFTIKNRFTNNYIIGNEICELFCNIDFKNNNNTIKYDNLIGEMEFEIILS